MRSEIGFACGYLVAVSLAAGAVVLPAGTAHAQSGPTQNQAPPATTIELNLGEQTVLSATGVRSYSEGIGGIIDVRLTGDATQFVVVGTGVGTTTLLFLMMDGTQRQYVFNVVDPFAEDTGSEAVADGRVGTVPNIRLDLYFVQLDKSYSHNVGMDVPSTVAFGQFNYALDITNRVLSPNTAIVGTELLPQLELAETNGWGKVRRHVAVITRNGTQAKFDSGGEFNIQIAEGNAVGVESITFGSVLAVQPLYDSESQRIELQIIAEVADLTSTSGNVPGRTRSKLTSVVNLALGESVAVAGLTSRQEQAATDGIYGLSRIPILGLLFGSESRSRTDTENMVFVVPSVVQPMSRARGREFVAEAMHIYDTYSGKMREDDSWLMPPANKTGNAGGSASRRQSATAGE